MGFRSRPRLIYFFGSLRIWAKLQFGSVHNVVCSDIGST